MTEVQSWFLLFVLLTWVSMWAAAYDFWAIPYLFAVAASVAFGMAVWVWLT